MDVIQSKTKIKVPRSLVSHVLKDRFNLSYRRITHSCYLANSDRSLVLRQQYAKIMLPLLLEGKRIVNIDESSIPFLDFRRAKWAPKGEKNSISVKDLSAKVNLLAALDTNGSIYAALT